MKNPIRWLTREIRTRKALEFILPKEIHVDVGCGSEKYLLKKSPCHIKIGFDKQLGEFIDKKIPLEDNGADYITMLAVIEHLSFPLEIVKECYRILRDEGILIITTPKAKGSWIMKFYAPHFAKNKGEHKQYFNYRQMQTLLKGYFSIRTYRNFEFGFNQLFVCEKLH